MQLKSRRKAARGFTLIELVIVIAVIAILAALLVPTILGQAERARISRAKSDAAEIAKALARMRSDTTSLQAGCYTTLANLTATTVPVGATSCAAVATDVPNCDPNDPTQAGTICWGGPYMSTVPANDPWNQPWSVTVNGTTKAITVLSGGPSKSSANTADNIEVTQ